jgi:hypothetical protein
MSTKKWFGGVVVLSAALSLAIAGSALAQSQERGSGKASGSYGAGQGTGSGSQYGKQQAPQSGCNANDPSGVCTPPAASKKTKPSTSRPSGQETSR